MFALWLSRSPSLSISLSLCLLSCYCHSSLSFLRPSVSLSLLMAQPRDLQWVDIYNITSTPHWAMSVPSAPTIATGVVVGGVESGVLGTPGHPRYGERDKDQFTGTQRKCCQCVDNSCSGKETEQCKGPGVWILLRSEVQAVGICRQ